MDDTVSRPDEPEEEYEGERDEVRESLAREAGLTALGGPAFGPLFAKPDDEEYGDEQFDAEHNP